MADDNTEAVLPNAPNPRRRAPLPWFVLGFAVTWILMAILWPMEFYDGKALWNTRLWQYYLLEIHLEMKSSGYLGPTSGNTAAALNVALTHTAISAVAGAACSGLVWARRKMAE